MSHSADRLRTSAASVARLRLAALQAGDAKFRESLTALKRFQAQRLANTHCDLLESPRYRAATRFFLEDLYGEKDFSQRDTELGRVVPTLIRFLPDQALTTIADAIELDALSEYLDQKMAVQGLAEEGAAWSKARYGRAYRAIGELCDLGFEGGATGAALRERQLGLVPKIGQTLDKLVKNPFLGGLLAAMAGPARIAGVPTMHDFLTRGFKAFQSMRGAGEFIAKIDERERSLSDQLLAGQDLP
jgi:hypothetical protein